MISKKYNKKSEFLLKMGLSTFLISTAIASPFAYAQPIKELKNVEVEVPTSNSSASNKYAVIAGFSNKTEVKTFGDAKWETFKDDDNQPVFNISNPSKDLKGKFGVIYTNIGNYKGKPLDLKITINDWNKYNNPDKRANITYGKDSISHMQSGFNWVDQTWEYIDHETQQPVKVSGSYMTFSDLDALQYIQFDKETTKKIDKLYVSKDTWVDGQYKDGVLKIGEINNKESTSNDKFAMVTGLFSGGKMHFKWGKDNTGVDKNLDKKSGTEFFSFDDKKPVKTEILKPAKTVSDLNEKLKQENQLTTLDETVNYEITHTVPNEYQEFFYKSYSITDNVIKDLNVGKEVKIVDENDKDVSSKFENLSKDNHIEFKAKIDELKKSDFYGHTYKVMIPATLKSDVDLSKLTDKDGFITFDNTANVEKDGKELPTNKVKTKIKRVKTDLHKFILDKNGKDVKESKFNIGENYKYKITGTVGNDKEINDFAIIDDGENVLDFHSAKILDEKGKDITKEGILTLDKKESIIKWIPKDIKSVVGKTFNLEIDASIKANTKLKDYIKGNEYHIPNTAQFIINKKTIPTDKVVVKTPKVENHIKKYIIKDNKLVDKEDVKKGDKVSYLVEHEIGNGQSINKIILSDDNEDVLNLDKNVKVYIKKEDFKENNPKENKIDAKKLKENDEKSKDNSENKSLKDKIVETFSKEEKSSSEAPNFEKDYVDITSKGHLKVDEKSEKYEWSTDDKKLLEQIEGKKLYVEESTEIKKDANYSKFSKKDRITVPNIAEQQVNDKKIKSNEVDIFLNKDSEKVLPHTGTQNTILYTILGGVIMIGSFIASSLMVKYYRKK